MCCNNNGRCCCTPVVIITIVLILCGLLGAGFLGGGISSIAVTKYVRKQQLRDVEGAASAWKDNTSASSLQKFQNFVGYVSLTPGPQKGPSCYGITLPLTASSCEKDVYLDEAARFQGIPQLSFCASVSYSIYTFCDLQVTFLQGQPGDISNTTLKDLPDLSSSSAGVVDISMYGLNGPQKCTGKSNCNNKDCIKKCRDYFNGALRCGSEAQCQANTYVSGVGIKVAYQTGSSSRFAVDTAKPDVGTPGAGAYVLPRGYKWVTYSPSSGQAPLWQYQQMAYSVPQSVVLRVRSSSDPYLAYMATTDGSGYFVSTKDVKGLGIALIVIGSVILLGVMIFSAFTLYARSLYTRAKAPPTGCFKRMSWNYAVSVYGPHPSAVVVPLQQAQLVAQPVVYPPPYQYPTGYAQPPPQGYAQPPPQGYAQPPPQGYAQPPPQGYAQPPPQGYAQPPPQGYTQPPPQGYAQPPPSDSAGTQPAVGYAVGYPPAAPYPNQLAGVPAPPPTQPPPIQEASVAAPAPGQPLGQQPPPQYATPYNGTFQAPPPYMGRP